MSSSEYNQLLKFLYFEGYADSYEEAENLLEEMSDEEFEELLERKYDKDEPLPGSGKTPRQKMQTKRGQHAARVMLGNPALGRSARNDPERDSYRNRASMMDRVKDAQDKGEEPRDDEGRKNLIKAARRPRASYERQDNRPGGLRAGNTKAGGHRTLVRKEEFDAIAEYLFVEGYVDTIESAEVMAENISEQWAEIILEKDETEIGITGLPIPAKKMSPAKRYEFEKKRRENLKKTPGTPGDSPLIQAMRNKAQDKKVNEAKADPKDPVQTLIARNKRLVADHPEVPSGKPQTEFRRKRHQESRGKRKER